MRVLGLDLGRRRIGVAVSDRLGLTAQPYDVLDVEDGEPDVAAIGALARTLDVSVVVVGLPLDANGEVGRQAQWVLSVVEALDAALPCDVHTWDERFTTVAAQRVLIEGGVRRTRRKRVVDKVAASLILQSWLEAQSGEQL